MTIGKTIALATRTFVGKVMSLLFHTLSRFVIAFLPRSKQLEKFEKELIHAYVQLNPHVHLKLTQHC